MLSLLGFLFFIFIFTLLFFVAIGLWIIFRMRMFLRRGAKRKFRENNPYNASRTAKKDIRTSVSKKIVSGGEYVDYEEVPQDNDGHQSNGF